MRNQPAIDDLSPELARRESRQLGRPRREHNYDLVEPGSKRALRFRSTDSAQYEAQESSVSAVRPKRQSTPREPALLSFSHQDRRDGLQQNPAIEKKAHFWI